MKKILLLLLPIIIGAFLWSYFAGSADEVSKIAKISQTPEDYERAKFESQTAAKAKAAELRARIEPIDCSGAPEAALTNEVLPELLQDILSIDCYQSGHRIQTLEGEAWLVRIEAVGPIVLPVFYEIKAQVAESLAEEDHTVGHNAHFTSIEHKFLDRGEGLALFANLPDSVVWPNAKTLPVENFLEIKAVNQDGVEFRLYLALLSESAQGIDKRVFQAFGFGCKPDCDYDNIFKIMKFDEIANPSTLPPIEAKDGSKK